MWYKSTQYPLTSSFIVHKSITQQFADFCEEEILWYPHKRNIEDLILTMSRDIFLSNKINMVDSYFMGFVLSYFFEKRLPFNDEELLKFFANKTASNPIHLLILSNSHLYKTVKEACYFLGAVHPSNDVNLWEKYFINHQNIFSDPFFVSEKYLTVLEEKKSILRAYLLNREKIQSTLLEPEKTYQLYIPALLKTNLIERKIEKYQLLIQELFRQKVLTPVMPYPYEPPLLQNIFEHAMSRPRESNMWWIKDMILNYQEYFDYSLMVKYFEGKIVPDFYMEKFVLEFTNYKESVELMKKVALKQKMQLSLLSKEKNEKITKI